MNNYKVRFVALGGIIGVTKNMYLYELHENDLIKDILIVDCGIGFPEEKELGVDFVIPDISYLMDKKDKIRAILLTHGHEDHIGALPFLYESLGKPVIIASKLTAVFVENKFKENKQTVKVERVNFDKKYQLGGFEAEYVQMTHSIPDTTHIIIKSPIGIFYHGSDYKLDLTPPYGNPPDFYKIAKTGHDGILALLSDCLGSERPGLTLSESVVGKTFEDEMRKTKGKFIMTTFSSNISRIRQCVEAAVKFNRKVVFLGRSMKQNSRLAAEIGYLPIPDSLTANEDEISKIPPNKVCIIAAGSQGQYGSALSKLADKQNPFIKIRKGDKVIFSSDPIPGNENEVYGLIEDLVTQGAEVIYSDIADQLHSSGHGNQEDQKFLIRFTNPRFFVPIGGTVRHQKQYQKLVGELGFDDNRVLALREGETVWFYKDRFVLGEAIETKNIYVDAYGIGDVGNIVLRDRRTISQDGIVFVAITVDSKGNLAAVPKISSRGFVYEKDEDKLYQEAVKSIEKVIDVKVFVNDLVRVKRSVISSLENFFFKKRGRKPLIVVEVIRI